MPIIRRVWIELPTIFGNLEHGSQRTPAALQPRPGDAPIFSDRINRICDNLSVDPAIDAPLDFGNDRDFTGTLEHGVLDLIHALQALALPRGL